MRLKRRKWLIILCLVLILVAVILVRDYIAYQDKYFGDVDKEETMISSEAKEMAALKVAQERALIIGEETAPPALVVNEPTEDFVIEVTDQKAMAFQDFLKSVTVTYPHEELFGIKEAMDMHKNVVIGSESHTDLSVMVNDRVQAKTLYEHVLENNELYLKNLKDNGGINMHGEISKKEVKRICELISIVTNDFIEQGLFDADKMDSILLELKVFMDYQPRYGAVGMKYIMSINKDMMKVATMNRSDLDADTDVYDHFVIHETMHLGQIASTAMSDANTYDSNYGTSYKWDELLVNPLMLTWFVEASAEKCTADYCEEEPITYIHMINYMESLAIANVLGEQNEVDQLQNLHFQFDQKRLSEYFDCTTESDSIDLYEMLYGLEIIHMDPEAFYTVLSDEKHIEMTDDDISALKFTIKAAVMTDLSKQFYSNLMNRVQHEDVNLNDAFYLITLFETDVNSHIKCNKEMQLVYNQDFFETYTRIQDAFFETIIDSETYSQDELLEAFSNYGPVVQMNEDSYVNGTFGWLSEDKVTYLETMYEKLKSYYGYRIREVYQAAE